MSLLRLVISSAAFAALALATPATAADSDELVRRTVSVRNVPVLGAPEIRVGAGASLTFPKTWRLTRRSPASFTLREGTRSCQYTVRSSVRVAVGDETDAAAHAAAALPATPRFVVDGGVRERMAWRVIRVPESGFVRLEGVAVDPLSSFVNDRAGRPLWLETRVSARSDVGDECHAGTWRDTAGPRIGDALAIHRGRAFLMP